MTIVQTVESWYEANLERLKPDWQKVSISSYEATDPVRGKVEIRAGSESLLASITFWNKRDVCVICLKLPPKTDPSVIDDRVISPSENLDLLLESYFEQLAERRR